MRYQPTETNQMLGLFPPASSLFVVVTHLSTSLSIVSAISLQEFADIVSCYTDAVGFIPHPETVVVILSLINHRSINVNTQEDSAREQTSPNLCRL